MRSSAGQRSTPVTRTKSKTASLEAVFQFVKKRKRLLIFTLIYDIMNYISVKKGAFYEHYE